MVTLTQLPNFSLVISLRIALEAEGIEVFIPNENTSILFPIGEGIRVNVREEDLPRAEEIYREWIKS